MSFLNRADELAAPSWPAESINTGMAFALFVATPRILQIKQVLLMLLPLTPSPIQITLSAVNTPPGSECAYCHIGIATNVKSQGASPDGRVITAGCVAQ